MDNELQIRGDIHRLTVSANDIIVVTCEGFVSDAYRDRLTKYLREAGLTQPVIILDGGSRVGVLSPSDGTHPGTRDWLY